MQFDRFGETSVDIQSGLMTLYVRAPTKEQAREISDIILDVTEIQVNTLSQQLFDQRQTHVFTALDDAHNQLTQAQAALVELQIKYQEVDPRNRIESIYVVIRDLEAQAQELSTFIQRAEIAGVSNSSQTLQSIELERSLRELIEVERTRLVTPIGSSETSLNSLLIEFELANLNVGLAQDAVKTALTAQSRSAQEAALSRSIFQIVVPPGTAQTALYPKIPGILALTLVISLTALATISLFWRPKWRAATNGIL
jgi:capsule polysaccharide export protein KpsE/RkpR